VIVREALVSDPRVLQAGASVREAAELLSHPNVRSALVAEGDRLVGCVTAESIVAALAQGVDVDAATAADVCERGVTTIEPDVALDEALHLMAEQDLERLPVTENGRLLGVLPRETIARRLAEDQPPKPAEDEARS
jgi:predicted transcriptional regulator